MEMGQFMLGFIFFSQNHLTVEQILVSTGNVIIFVALMIAGLNVFRMRRRSPSYSPPRRGYGGRDRSPPRGRYGGYRDAPCGLLVRNIPKGSRFPKIKSSGSIFFG